MKNLITILSFVSLISIFGCSGKKATQDQTTEEKTSVAKAQNNSVVIQLQSEPDTLKGSLEAEAIGKIGGTEIKISYHAPAVRGRIVWGGLVPFDKVWVTGAHMATSIEFSVDVLIGNKSVVAGKYALFTIPGKEEWTVIINKNWEQHLTDQYDEKDDVVRMKIKPEIEDTHQERLRYVVEADSNTEGEIVIYWEKLEVSLPITTKQ